MSSYDLYFPKDRYEEIEKALQASSEVCHGKYRQAERLDKTTALAHRNQRERYLHTASDLRKEKEVQEAVYKFTTDDGGRLDSEKSQWFSHGTPSSCEIEMLSDIVKSYWSRQSDDICVIPNRTLHTTSMLIIANGRRFLLEDH